MYGRRLFAFALSAMLYARALACAPLIELISTQFFLLCSIEHNKKNWLFSDTQAGAYASSLVYSIVETAKASGVEIYNYLKYLLQNPPTSQTPDEELEKLCPWNLECQKALEEMHRKDLESVFNT